MQEESRLTFVNEKAFHLAGIIPLDGQPLDFNLPWHDCFLPIAPNYLLIENAIYECAAVGCETIWIVSHTKMLNLLKTRVGHFVSDPTSHSRVNSPFVESARKWIPIYYVESHPKWYNKRESLVWSSIYGARTARDIAKQFSDWVNPDRFYIKSPYGFYGLTEDFYDKTTCEVRKFASKKKNIYLAGNGGETFLNKNHLAFSFGKDQLTHFNMKFYKKSTGRYSSENYKIVLPPKEQWSGRFFGFDDIFDDINDQQRLDVDSFFPMHSWESYTNSLARMQSLGLKVSRPKNFHIKKDRL